MRSQVTHTPTPLHLKDTNMSFHFFYSFRDGEVWKVKRSVAGCYVTEGQRGEREALAGPEAVFQTKDACYLLYHR